MPEKSIHSMPRLKAAVLCFSGVVFALTGSAGSATASETAQMCDRAAHMAAQSQNVPMDVLQAISRVETGRGRNGRLEPWPWTVNMEGIGKWFSSEDEARAYVFRHFKRGARSFDVGCFQINYKWHGAAFRSIDEMFDPIKNAEYAAKFLRDLYREFGDWSAAAGAYHSRTTKHARTYAARFERVRAETSSYTEPARQPDPAPQRVASSVFIGNASTPLVATGAARLGSLVPLTQGNGRRFSLIK